MINKNLYCSMIHGGLHLQFENNNTLASHCCLLVDNFKVDPNTDFWQDKNFVALRAINTENQWGPGCGNCKLLETSNLLSFRQGMNQGLEIHGQTDLLGPARIDLKFDIGCNLACRICGPYNSTFWQKHLKENGLWTDPITPSHNKNQVISALQQLDLSNLKQLVFCGGETLMGQEYWEVADWLGDNVPNAKKNLTLGFQTNGTQDIDPKNYKIIDKFHLVKLHVSLDGIGEQFEYQRWPASWNQVCDNLLNLKQNIPSNVMFLIEETISIFNLAYLDRLENWIQQNFTSNREGDIVDHTRHLAKGTYSVNFCSQEYVDFVQKTPYLSLIPNNWQERPDQIRAMLKEIKKFDQFRNESFKKVFPEVAEYYARFW